MTMKLLCLTLVASIDAFHMLPVRQGMTTTRLASTKDENHITINPLEGYRGVDMVRAKECAEHFGKCSLEEVESLRDNLHKERLQKYMFTSPMSEQKIWEDSLNHRLLEEELDLQLELMKEHGERATNQDLFPALNDDMEQLPHLKDGTPTEQEKEVIHRAELALALEETVLEESVLETAGICASILLLLCLPQLLHM